MTSVGAPQPGAQRRGARPARLPYFAVSRSDDVDVGRVVDRMERDLGVCNPRVLLFFASPRYDFSLLCKEVAERFGEVLTLGCTSAGEMDSTGSHQGSVLALALGSPFRAAATMVPDLGSARLHLGTVVAANLSRQLGLSPHELSGSRHVFVTLLDGLVSGGEVLVAAIRQAAGFVPLVGGSAADDFQFRQTWVGLNGRACSGGAVVLLLETGFPFHPFLVHHLHPTPGRLVVTRAAVRQRLLCRLNGHPALHALAQATGIPLADLEQDASAVLARARVQLGYRVGDRWFIRSVMRGEGTCLRMASQVEEGAVLSLMRGGDLVEETRAGMADAAAHLGGEPALVLAFNCGGRVLEAHACGLQADTGHALDGVPLAGFVTYGEQFGSMLANHTLTGLMMGWPDGH